MNRRERTDDWYMNRSERTDDWNMNRREKTDDWNMKGNDNEFKSEEIMIMKRNSIVEV